MKSFISPLYTVSTHFFASPPRTRYARQEIVGRRFFPVAIPPRTKPFPWERPSDDERPLEPE